MADSSNGTSNGSGQKQFRVIGTRPIRHDGVDKVTGRAKYGADYSFPGMLYGKVLRSPHAHARLIAIRTEKAAALPGVKAIITGADLPDIPGTTAMMGELVVNTHYLSLNVMARGKVLYDGHAVAAVAATSPHIAEEALRLIEVDYEPLPPVMTAEAAMKPDAPILLEEIRQKFIAGRTDPGSPEGPDRPTNVAAHIQFQRGDLEAGFRAADYVVEREFKTATVHQGYIEPHNAVALYSSDGHATIYCSTQGTFNVRTLTATVLKMNEGDIKVVPAEIGGGFGGKTTIYLEPLAVLLAQKSGRPVKMTMSRAEVLRASGPTSGTWIKGKMGATRDGKITAAQFWMAYEAGGFPGSPFAPGRDVLHGALRHPQPAAGFLRRGGQPAQGSGVSRAGIAKLGLCLRIAGRRAGAALRNRSARPAYHERRARGHAATRRPAVQAHRFYRNLRGAEKQRVLPLAAYGSQPRTRRRCRLLVQRRPAIGGGGQPAQRRHAERGHRLGRYRRVTRLHGDDRGRGAGHGGRGRAFDRRRHRLDRPYRRHRRQPHHARHRDGGLRSGRGRGAPAQGTRRKVVGEEAPRKSSSTTDA